MGLGYGSATVHVIRVVFILTYFLWSWIMKRINKPWAPNILGILNGEILTSIVL